MWNWCQDGVLRNFPAKICQICLVFAWIFNPFFFTGKQTIIKAQWEPEKNKEQQEQITNNSKNKIYWQNYDNVKK